MTKKIFVISLCFVFIGLFFVGCVKKSPTERGITLMWWGDRYNRAFAQKLVDIYNGKNPEIKIKLFTSTNYESKLLSMCAGGMPPDIMLISAGKHLEYASKEIFLALDKYENNPDVETLKKDMWPYIWDDCRYKGKLYTVPIWTNSIGIFYNKTLFDNAGVSYPTSDWTFDDLFDKAKRLTFDFDGDGRIDQFGFSGIPLFVSSWNLDMLTQAFGGHFYSEDGRSCLIDSKEAIEAIQWAIDLMNKHHICPTTVEVETGVTSASGSGEDYFRAGKVAMVYWGRWYIDTLRKKSPSLNWAVAPYPKGKKKVMYQIVVYLAISSKTKYPDECWEFLKFMIGKEGQRLITNDRSDMPILKSMAYSKEFLNYSSRPDANKVFIDMLEYARIPKFILGSTEWQCRAKDRLELVALGKLSLKEAAKKIAEEYKKMVAKE